MEGNHGKLVKSKSRDNSRIRSRAEKEMMKVSQSMSITSFPKINE